MAWLSRPGNRTVSSEFSTGLGLKFTVGDMNRSMRLPSTPPVDNLFTWLRNSNLSRMSWTLSENPSRYASKFCLSCCWAVEVARARRVNCEEL